MALDLITTTAGRTAILTAIASAGTLQVKDVQLSGTNQAVSTATTTLSSVVATLTTVSGSIRPAGAGNALHLLIKDESAAAYDVRALAVRLMDNTVLLVYSQAGIIATKASGSTLHLAIDLTIDADTAATITFGTTDYELPAAGESAPGIIELATNAEVLTGTDALRAVTPARLTAKLQGLSDHQGLAYSPAQSITLPIPLPASYSTESGLAWTGSAAGPMRKSVQDGAVMWVQLDPHLPEGCIPASFTVRVKPGAARTGANRMTFILWYWSRTDETVTGALGSPAFDNGTTSAQDVVLGSTGQINKSTTTWWLSITGGNTGASAQDTIFNLFTTLNVTHPLKK